MQFQLTCFILLGILVSITTISAQRNRFKEAPMYVNPQYQAKVDTLIKTISADSNPNSKPVVNNLKLARDAPTAYWLDSISKVQLNNTSLDSMQGVLLDASKKLPVPTVVFVIHNLPNRDCSFPFSLGEICCGAVLANGQCDFLEENECTLGLNTYKSYFIDNIVSLVRKFKDVVPMAFILEPNGFPLLIRQKNPRCGYATQTSIKKGLEYAVFEIQKAASEFPIYMDLGNELSLGLYTKIVADVLKPLSFYNALQGFAINVGNYQPLGKLCPAADWCRPANNNGYHACCMDPCNISQRGGNPGNTEINYAQSLLGLYPNKTFVIDTSRNGELDSRTNCFNWCNIKKAGLGVLPTAETGVPFVDAYLWIKNPGDTDGCTEDLPNGNGKCPLFTKQCASPDSFLSTGPAGVQLPLGNFSFPFLASLAQNANFVPSDKSWAVNDFGQMRLLIFISIGMQFILYVCLF